jgi:hypothetical protein
VNAYVPNSSRASQRETAALPCATSARQTLCRAFFVGAHGKGRTVAFCTVKPLCRAPRLTTHGRQSLSCVFSQRTAKKNQLTAPAPNSVGHPLPCAGSKTHGKHGLFAVRLPGKRTANTPCAWMKNTGFLDTVSWANNDAGTHMSLRASLSRCGVFEHAGERTVGIPRIASHRPGCSIDQIDRPVH